MENIYTWTKRKEGNCSKKIYLDDVLKLNITSRDFMFKEVFCVYQLTMICENCDFHYFYDHDIERLKSLMEALMDKDSSSKLRYKTFYNSVLEKIKSIDEKATWRDYLKIEGNTRNFDS